jgi:hypothetical protein
VRLDFGLFMDSFQSGHSHLHEELDVRLAKAERVGYGFTIPKLVAPNAPKISTSESLQIAT